MLHTIASYHAATIREMKFRGYKGSPLLWTPTPITTPMLFALRSCHKLESLVLSMWLSTWFEDAARDEEVIAYWLNSRKASSTALVLTTSRKTDDNENAWARSLRTIYAPDAVAKRVTAFIGPFLSDRAKARKDGVHVRASFCLGDWGGIFDVDVRIGKAEHGTGDVCLGFEGPREELEKERRQAKLDSRGWF